MPPPWYLLGLLCLLLLLYRRCRAARWLTPLALGFAWAWGHALIGLGQVLPAELEGRDMPVSGTVIGLPEHTAKRSRFLFRVETAVGAPALLAKTLRLSWYADAPALTPGQRWAFTVRLKRPHGVANEGGFDYAGWLFREGIRASGYVRTKSPRTQLPPRGEWLSRLRFALRQQILRLAGPEPAAALIPALTVGDRSAITPEQWRLLTRTGTNHLIAISGLHVSIVAGLAFFLVQFGWRRSQRLSARLAAVRAAALGALPAALAYAALAGFAISTQRALIMLTVVFAGLFLRRTLRPWSALFVALFCVLLVDPLAGLSPGFWLSFAAVALLLFAIGQRVAGRGLAWKWGRAQWVVGLGLLPLVLLFFGQASLIAPLVNLLAVPLFSVLLLPLTLVVSLVSVLFELALPLQLLAGMFAQGMAFLDWVAAPSWTAATLAARPPWVWPLAFAGIVLLLAPRGLPGRWLGLVLWLPMWTQTPQPPASGAFRFSLLDVGQGLAGVVQTRHHALVFDTGAGFSDAFNAGEAIIAPWLKARGIARLDRLIVSHADQDHAGGMAGLLDAVPVAAVYSGEPARLARPGILACAAGEHWNWDGVMFSVLHPPLGDAVSGNNASCVLRVANAAGALLLTGDADRTVERRLARRYRTGLASRVLVAGHHGSNSSTSVALLAAVAPDYVLFSAGYRNRYGFPRPQVLARVAAAGAAALSSIDSGGIDFVFNENGVLEGPWRQRHEQQRYWMR